MMGLSHEEYSCHWGFVVLAGKFCHWAIMTGLLKSFSIFIPHLVELMGTSYAVIGLVCSVADSLGCLAAPLGAFILKRVTARNLGVFGALLCSSGMIGAAFCTRVLPLGVCMATLGLGNVFLVITITTNLHQHFPAKFDVINTISLIGSPTGAFITPVITENLLEIYGLAGTILILGGLSFNLVVCALVLRPPRRKRRWKGENDIEYMRVQKPDTDADKSEAVEDGVNSVPDMSSKSNTDDIKTKQRTTSWIDYIFDITNLSVLRRTPSFVLLLLPNLLMMVVWMGWTLFLVPHAESLGISQSKAAYLAMLGGFGGITGLICTSIFLVFYPQVALKLPAATSLIGAFVFFLDLASSHYVFQAIHAFLIGVLIYHTSVYISVGVKYALPDEDFTMGLGLAVFFYAIGTITGGMGSGLIYDLTQDYKLVFVAFGLAEILISIFYIGFVVVQSCQRKKREALSLNGSKHSECKL
ncbi:monocarboxylate transporter 2-like [Lytechinus variegatus]|uniref:monocarboxylate transporter 2-like n=1 Tax=Lytechinus variegatus TaxID=7654 RepID=UPI001BB0DEEB|nr:monocarboxylate transporter 2-like [Lytechinus variegatus]